MDANRIIGAIGVLVVHIAGIASAFFMAEALLLAMSAAPTVVR